MKATYKYLIGGLVIALVLAALAVEGLQENTVYFYKASEVLADPEGFADRSFRVGALIQPGSVVVDAKAMTVAFNAVDEDGVALPVTYRGVAPDMFKEGQGVVAEGRMEGGALVATRLLVKHSEEYQLDPGDHQKSKEDYARTINP